MDQPISAAEANRRFSLILREVGAGTSYVVTRHGRPVARIVPAASSGGSAPAARDALLARLESQPVTDVGRWTRDDLYAEDP